MSDGRVVVAGTGIHPYGRHDSSITDLGVVAVADAVAEAGITDRTGIGATFCGTAYGGVATAHKILGALGLTGGPIIDMEAGCASGAAALMVAAGAISAGQYDCVLVFGVEKMPKGMIRSSFFEPWQEQAGLTPAPAYFALRAQRVLRESGVTERDLADVVVKNRAHGAHNPTAMYRSEVKAEAVLDSKMICPPLRLWMLCTPNEGAAAVVLRRAGTGGSSAASTGGGATAHLPEVTIAATRLVSHIPGNVLGEDTPLSGIDDGPITSPTAMAAGQAYEAAGIGPAEVDVAEVQDTDAARELLAYEELGFCPAGGAGEWFRAGHSQIGGSVPVNVSGGILSRGEPLGASAVGHVVALTRQLQGRPDGVGLERPRVALAHNVGRGANASVTILTT